MQAITVKGFGGSPDKKDVYDYFKEFNPVSMELVDGNTINVVWALPASAAKAMLSLSRPLLEREMEMEVKCEPFYRVTIPHSGCDKPPVDTIPNVAF